MAAFIRTQWTEREVERFHDLLAEFERLVVQFPFGWPVSESYPDCRRAVIHKNASIIYRVDPDAIRVVTILDNRSSKPR